MRNAGLEEAEAGIKIARRNINNLLFASGDQSIGASAPASVLPVNIQGSCPLGLTGLQCLDVNE